MNANKIPDLLSALLAKRTLAVNHVPQGTGLDSARTGEWLRREVKAVEQQLLAAGIDPKLVPWPAAASRAQLRHIAGTEKEGVRLFEVHLDALVWTCGYREQAATVLVPATNGGMGQPVTIRRTFGQQDQSAGGGSRQTITAHDGAVLQLIGEGYEPHPTLHADNDGRLLVR